MQNRGAIWLFTILLGLACLYQISFSYFTADFEKEANQFGKLKADSVRLTSKGNLSVDMYEEIKTSYADKYLKDNAGKEIYPGLGFTYAECKEWELSMGLDLQGGMSVTLEVSVPEMVVALSGDSKDPDFNKAMALALENQKNSQGSFIGEFDKAYRQVAPNGKLAAIFHSQENAAKFPLNATNEQIIETLQSEARIAIDNVEKILRNRIDKFGVVQPNIQKQQYTGRILIDLPGVKDKTRVRKVLQSTANLEFWETYDNVEISPVIEKAEEILSETLYPGARKAYNEKNNKGQDTTAAATDTSAVADTAKSDTAKALADILGDTKDTTAKDTLATADADDPKKVFPLYSLIRPAIYQDEKGQLRRAEGCMVGSALVSDTDKVNVLINNDIFKANLPSDLRLLWGSKPSQNNELPLYAIKANTPDGKAPLDGSSIVDARQDFGIRGDVEVTMRMNSEGAQIWADLTTKNQGHAIAIVLDDHVQSAPTVNDPITDGSSRITMGAGNRTEQLNEATDLANVLRAGALPAPAKIVDEAVVGPSLGKENINAGLLSFAIALAVIMLYMFFYYNMAGLVADLALIVNLFFIVGTLASLQASLTMPGIAGIILTMGIAVDANVLVYERVKEELRGGKGLQEALKLGYKRAASAIIDGNLTTLLTAFVLAAFGTGPIKGFATTLIIGILCSLFSAIFISRLVFTSRRYKDKAIRFSNSLTENLFRNANYDWVGKRKLFYTFSAVIFIAGFISFFTRGFSLGVDFTGGRTYTIEFKEVIDPEKVRVTLAGVFGSAPEVKTIGAGNQLKITTNYLMTESTADTDGKVKAKLDEGLNKLNTTYTEIESRKVDSTISDDLVRSSVVAIGFSLLIIFAYIVFRFRKWQFGLGALLALFHDIGLILIIFSLFHGILPFSMDIDQAFIAALLTILGYSINDTVVVFDRIREYLNSKSDKDSITLINNALNSTLSRTLNVSFATFIVMFMIFIFGGDSIKGFVFALLVGIVVGTYSSLCIATPVVVDFGRRGDFVKKA